MNIRKIHKTVGVIFAPFFILTSLTGFILLFRKDDLYSKEVKKILIGLHNWEIGAKYIGAVLSLALLILSFTGLILYFRGKKTKRTIA